jgi:pyruvate/2-oxoacid:ferredoxin oxidoreductase alpha subunit
MAEVNRTLGSPWGFWPDQSDSLAQRDTGWIQLYCEHNQESLDTVIQAFKIAEQCLLPAMVVHEAFYVSHALEPVTVPSQEAIDDFLPPFDPPHKLDPARGESWGNTVNQDMFYRHRKAMGEAMDQVPELVRQANAEYAEKLGRSYGDGILELYRAEDAEMLIVGFGAMCGTERNFSPGAGGCLHQELKAALYGMPQPPLVHGYLAGVGGVNVSPAKIEELARKALTTDPVAESVWQRWAP